MRLTSLLRPAAIALAVACAAPIAAAQADEQYFPLQSYRVGPYAAGGTGFFGGFIDYLNLINIRDGGVNGVKLTWERVRDTIRGRTRRRVLRAAEEPSRCGRLEPALCRHRLRHDRPDHAGQGAADHGQPWPHRFNRRPRVPLRLPIAAQPVQRDLGHHQLHRHRSSAASDTLKGKKIVVLYHGSPYGKETIPIYELLSKKYGFEVQQIEVPHPGNEQQSQWLTIRRAKPDYVVLRGWGVMNPVAIKTAVRRSAIPVDHIIGNVWSNSEEDVIPAGDAAIGYIAITTQASGNAISGAAGDHQDRLRRRQGQPRRQEAHRLASTTTSASSTASSTSRRSASRRKSSAITR